MNDYVRELDIVRVDRSRAAEVRDVVSRESRVMVMLNDVEVVSLMCSPTSLDCLAVGYLFAEGLIDCKEDVEAVDVDEKGEAVRVIARSRTPPHGSENVPLIAASGGRESTAADFAERMRRLKSNSQITITPDSVQTLMKDFLGKSKGFERTGAIHSAALCNADRVLVFHEDIGRHNAIDKVVGQSMLEGISMDDGILVTSGRISAEILVKTARCGAPIVMSKSAPTDLAATLASDAGIAVIGFARGQRMNIYSNAWRITDRIP